MKGILDCDDLKFKSEIPVIFDKKIAIVFYNQIINLLLNELL